eukprot:4374965-Pyramimonas_sp.AAC.3
MGTRLLYTTAFRGTLTVLLFYGSSCANSSKGALDTPDLLLQHHIRCRWSQPVRLPAKSARSAPYIGSYKVNPLHCAGCVVRYAPSIVWGE